LDFFSSLPSWAVAVPMKANRARASRAFFINGEEAKVRKQNLAGRGWLGCAFLLVHAASKVRTATQSAKRAAAQFILV
jgi:hypothetical protein